MFLAIEGIDGAGKNTLCSSLHRMAEDAGISVWQSAFPRYGRSVHADLAADALYGRVDYLATDAHTMALLFALDRQQAKEELSQAIATHDLVIVDRYVASNVAYSCARLRQSIDGSIAKWIEDLEFERFALPAPDMTLRVAVSVEKAREQATAREAAESDRQRDSYETNQQLQQDTNTAYQQLAEVNWRSSWVNVESSAQADTLFAEIQSQIQ